MAASVESDEPAAPNETLQAYLDRAPKDDANTAQVRQAMEQVKAFTTAGVKEPGH